MSVSATPHTAALSHVAIIMDGNGRWAKAKGLPRTAGHKKGAETLRVVMDACRDHGVRFLTVYAFSSENWQRAPEEVADLMALLKLYLQRELNELHARGVRLRVIGDRTRLSGDVRSLIEQAEATTAENHAFTLVMALSYGSRQELAQAARSLAEQVAAGTLNPAGITEDVLASALYTAGLPEPDLLIRTGGEERLSNFLLWQLAYTELYFAPTLWPDFTAEHFAAAVAEFHTRERRYGTAA